MSNPPPIQPEVLLLLNDAGLKKPASMGVRTLAFIADALIASLLAFIVLKIAIPAFWGTEFSVFQTEYKKLWDAYWSIGQGGNIQANSEHLKAQAEAFSENADVVKIIDVSGTIVFFLSLFYFSISEYVMKGSSFGKKIFKIRVASQITGTPPSLWQSISRSIWRACMIAPTGILITIIVIINAHIPFFSYRRRGWHDKLSRTEVVDDK